MANIWFTSDTHFSHGNIIKSCNRPFSSIEEMNQTMIENWNKLIKPQDEVFHLGDFSYGDASSIESVLKKLNGKINLILGNHDRLYGKKFCFKSISHIVFLQDLNIHLCHYKMAKWNKSHYGSLHLFGHDHYTIPIDFESYEKLKLSTRFLNVCVDGNNFFPYHIDEITKAIQDNPINRDF